jgi:3-hydroxyacyl-[acyl-carrier-protein] dehydratase
VSINIPQALDRLCYRYPSMLVDAIVEHEPGHRLVAVKNITVNEEFFQGHFPGAPLLPGVLMVDALSQVAAILVTDIEAIPPTRVYLRGVNGAKFRRQVVPGDRLRLEITMGKRRGGVAFVQSVKIPARPYLRPAADVHYPRLADNIRKSYQRREAAGE